MQNGTTTLEDSLEMSYKTKHSYSTIQHLHFWYLPKGTDRDYIFTSF